MIYLWFDYNVIESVWLHFAFGHMTRQYTPDGVDKHYGTEYDLAAAFALAKGLSFTVRFGYFVPGQNIEDLNPGSDTGPHVHLDAEFKLEF